MTEKKKKHFVFCLYAVVLVYCFLFIAHYASSHFLYFFFKEKILSIRNGFILSMISYIYIYIFAKVDEHVINSIFDDFSYLFFFFFLSVLLQIFLSFCYNFFFFLILLLVPFNLITRYPRIVALYQVLDRVSTLHLKR